MMSHYNRDALELDLRNYRKKLNEALATRT
jgi:hypothetical protein